MSEDRSSPTALIDEYRAAYIAANPNRTPPQIAYEHGWFIFRTATGAVFLGRNRRVKVKEMMQRLKDRIR